MQDGCRPSRSGNSGAPQCTPGCRTPTTTHIERCDVGVHSEVGAGPEPPTKCHSSILYEAARSENCGCEGHRDPRCQELSTTCRTTAQRRPAGLPAGTHDDCGDLDDRHCVALRDMAACGTRSTPRRLRCGGCVPERFSGNDRLSAGFSRASHGHQECDPRHTHTLGPRCGCRGPPTRTGPSPQGQASLKDALFRRCLFIMTARPVLAMRWIATWCTRTTWRRFSHAKKRSLGCLLSLQLGTEPLA